MGTQWIRQENKKNPLAERADQTAAWIKSHREIFITSCVIIIGTLALGGYFVSRYNSLKTTAWEKFFIAQQYGMSGRVNEAFPLIKTIQDNFPKTDAAGYSMLFEGDLFFRQGNYKDAIQAYAKLKTRNAPKAALPFAAIATAKALEAEGNYPEAIVSNRDFIDRYPEHYLAPQAHSQLARCLEISGNMAEAKAAYEKIILLFPDTTWAQTARLKFQPPAPQSAAPQSKS